MTTPNAPRTVDDDGEDLKPLPPSENDEPRFAADGEMTLGDPDDSPYSRPPEEEEPRVPTTPGQKAYDSIVQASRAGAVSRRERAADEQLERTVERFMAQDSSGYWEVIRMGPSEMPEVEFGVVGRIVNAELESMSISELISGKLGGGTYHLVPKRSDNSAAEVPPANIKIAGDPKPKTSVGRAWLRRAQKDGILDDTERAQPDDKRGSNDVIAMMMSMMDKQREREQELDRQRREEEIHREAIRKSDEKAENLRQAAERERQEIREEKRRAAEMEEIKARRVEDQKLLEARLNAQLEMIRNESEIRIKQLEQQATMALKRQEMQLDIERRQAESRMTSGLGWEGLGELRKNLANAIADKTIKEAGLAEDEEDTSFMGMVGAGVKEALPDLLKTAADVLLPKFAGMLGGPAAAPPQQIATAQQPMGLPNIDGTPQAPQELPPVVEPDGDGDTQSTAAPAQQQGPTRDLHAQQAVRVAVMSVLAFARPVSILVTTQPDPDSAWGVSASPDGKNVADVYGEMAKEARVALTNGWDGFAAIVRKISPKDGEVLDAAVAAEGGREWITGFLAAGPWHPDQEAIA